jgi:hypothetical protein
MRPDIAETERLAIFVCDSDEMKEDGAHWRAFMPGKKDAERSFFRIDGLEYAEIARIGREVAAQRGKALHGWGVVRAREVIACSPLQLKVDEPPDGHGVIVGWPTERHKRVNLAQSLADAAETVQFPNPQTPRPITP